MLSFLCHLLPQSAMKVPNAYQNAPFKKNTSKTNYPLVVFSHGLSGTSEEHAVRSLALGGSYFVGALLCAVYWL
jgi:predicted alpha/beta-fold hydrolase